MNIESVITELKKAGIEDAENRIKRAEQIQERERILLKNGEFIYLLEESEFIHAGKK
jgi:transcriptional regulator